MTNPTTVAEGLAELERDFKASVAEAKRLRGELERERSAADQYRERLDVSEQAWCEQRTLSQSIGNRFDELFRAADTACRVWERHPSASLHEIRTAMRALRKCLNAPNGWRSELKSLAEQLEEATGLLREWLETADEQELNASPYEGTEAFLSRAPAQAAEPTVESTALDVARFWIEKHDKAVSDRNVMLERADSAESKLAEVRDIVGSDGDDQADDARVIRIRALLAPSQGEDVRHLECRLCGDPLDDDHPTGPCVPCHELDPSQGEGGGGNGL